MSAHHEFSLRMIYAGTPDFAVPTLKALVALGHSVVAVYTQPDRPAGRGHRLAASAVKQCALALGLPVFQPASLKTEEVQLGLREHHADIMIVAAYGLILPSAVLSIPRLGCINIHASLLPRFRGAAPIARAIMAGDAETGISIMQMDSGLDTGPVWSQVHCPIAPETTTGQLTHTLSLLGAKACIDILPTICVQKQKPLPQPETGVVLAPKMHKQEACIDWNQSAVVIERMIRACDPWPVAYTHFKNEIFRIFKAYVSPKQMGNALPGTIVSMGKEGMHIATSCGCLCVELIQRSGKKSCTPQALQQGDPALFMVGECFLSH